MTRDPVAPTPPDSSLREKAGRAAPVAVDDGGQGGDRGVQVVRHHDLARSSRGVFGRLGLGLLPPELGLGLFEPGPREHGEVVERPWGTVDDDVQAVGGRAQHRPVDLDLCAQGRERGDGYPNEIEHVWTRTGTAEVATDPMGLEVSDVFITLKPADEWQAASTQDELVESMSATLEGMPGMRSAFTQPIEMRVNEMIAGVRSDVGIKLFGDDFEELREQAAELRRVVEEIPGAADVTVEQLTGQAMLTIDVDRQAAGRYGIPAGEILEVVESLGTRNVGQVIDGQRRFDLVLRLGDDARSSAERIGQILIHTEGGAQVPLAAVADIQVAEGPSTVQREWAKRRVVIQANVRGRDVGSFVADARRALDDIDLPEGHYTTLGGQFENLERAQTRLLFVVPIALLLVFSLLYLTYGRAADALRVFTGVPFGAVGGIVALWVRDMPFSISAGVGFIALSGVAVLGDMVLVSYVMQLLERGRAPLDAIREAAETRLRPVLMTAMVAAFGFIPMAFNTGVGAEVQRPLATVVVGGMFTSTIATLLVLPVLYAALGAQAKARAR